MWGMRLFPEGVVWEQFWSDLGTIHESPVHGPASKWRAAMLRILQQLTTEYIDEPDTEITVARMSLAFRNTVDEAKRRGLL